MCVPRLVCIVARIDILAVQYLCHQGALLYLVLRLCKLESKVVPCAVV